MARIGVIVASRTICRWEAAALDEARRSAGAVYPLVLVHSGCNGTPMSIDGQWWPRLDRRIQTLRRRQPADPMSPVDARGLLEDSEWIEIGPPDHSMPASALKRLAAANLDAVLQIGCEDLHEEAIRFTSQGLWRHRHGNSTDDVKSRGLVGAFCRGQPAIASRLEAVTASGQHVLREAWTGIVSHSLYVSQTRCYWRAARLLGRQLRAPQEELCSDAQIASVLENHEEDSNYRGHIPLAARLAMGYGRHLFERLLLRHSWVVGLRPKRGHTLDTFRHPNSSGFITIPEPRDGFIADPFLIEHDGKHYIFVEHFRFASHKGVVSCLRVEADLSVSAPEVVLDRPYHLSFPFLWRENGELFMIPETGANRSVEMYRCARFPDRWELDTVLLEDTPGFDSTLVKAGDRYWLFTALKSDTDAADELHLYWSKSIRGPWHSHRRNPLLCDVRRARGAGAIFRVGSELIRPSQDCSRRYGWQINFNRICALSERDYREELIGRIDASWSPSVQGAHTWNMNSAFEVIDGPVWRPRGYIPLDWMRQRKV